MADQTGRTMARMMVVLIQMESNWAEKTARWSQQSQSLALIAAAHRHHHHAQTTKKVCMELPPHLRRLSKAHLELDHSLYLLWLPAALNLLLLFG